jgi:hypothetical protein
MNHHLETLALDPSDPRLDRLIPRYRSILIRRKTMTLQQIADQEGITSTRVRQIEVLSLRQLKGTTMILFIFENKVDRDYYGVRIIIATDKANADAMLREYEAKISYLNVEAIDRGDWNLIESFVVSKQSRRVVL